MGIGSDNREFSWCRALTSGVIGGLVGTIVMTQFQSAWNKASQELKSKCHGEPSTSEAQSGEEKEDATMKAAGKVASLAGREISHETKKRLGPVVHYGFGTVQGAAYGTVVEAFGGEGGLLAGLIFGAALFALADEVAVPALGLSGKPSEFPLPTHLYALAAHLVYGLSSEIARKGLYEHLSA